jgi:hypothetical protein
MKTDLITEAEKIVAQYYLVRYVGTPIVVKNKRRPKTTWLVGFFKRLLFVGFTTLAMLLLFTYN